jgi:hypothetical protein
MSMPIYSCGRLSKRGFASYLTGVSLQAVRICAWALRDERLRFPVIRCCGPSALYVPLQTHAVREVPFMAACDRNT